MFPIQWLRPAQTCRTACGRGRMSRLCQLSPVVTAGLARRVASRRLWPAQVVGAGRPGRTAVDPARSGYVALRQGAAAARRLPASFAAEAEHRSPSVTVGRVLSIYEHGLSEE